MAKDHMTVSLRSFV